MAPVAELLEVAVNLWKYGQPSWMAAITGNAKNNFMTEYESIYSNNVSDIS